jgi:hypothetical protein
MANERQKIAYLDAYLKYQERQEKLDRFYHLTELSVFFTAFSLSEISLSELKKIKMPRPNFKEASMIPRAARPKGVRLTRGWATYEEYSKVSGLELHRVEESAREGKLGPIKVIPETGENALFWPPEEHSKTLSDLLSATKKTYTVTMEAEARVSLEGELEGEKTRETFLKLASSHGNPEESSENALALLRQVCFIQEWTSFEVYLREVVAFLLRKHPEKIAASGRGKKTQVLSTDEVITFSQGFTSIEELRERMVQREIERRQAEGQSVHGLINFLKDEFRFERDPYCEAYIFRGERKATRYYDIAEIKEVRNALIHDSGLVPELFLETWPGVPHNSGEIIITGDYYLKAVLVLRSVGLGIAESIAMDQYTPE